MKKRGYLLLMLVLALGLLLTGCGEKGKYDKAMSLYESGQYEEAVELFTKLGEYENSQEMVEVCNKEIMYQTYADVFVALDGNTWFYNGGADTVLNGITFSAEEATIAQVYFDGNGKHENGSDTYPYIVNDQNIVLTMADGAELAIPYALADGEVKLGNNDYFSTKEVDEGLQGCWNVRTSGSAFGSKTVSDKSILFDDGKVVSEKASLAYGSTNGDYYYYGPYEGNYTLNFGGLDTDMSHGNEWFFNIIDGKVVVLNYDHVCQPSEKLPGEDGYQF